MEYESIKVDIIPGAENAEVLHFSQYDNKRPFFIELFNGGAEFIPESGMSLTLECRKRDGNIVILSDPVLTDNVAEFSTTEQLTACYGDNTAEIKIVDENDLVIGSANFIINVEKSPTCGGLVSESEIDNLTQQIEEITQEVIGNDYYNKAQTDALLENKADVSDLPDMTDYYKKTEVNNLLNGKVDKTTLQEDYYDADYISTQFARKSFVENYVDATATASGNPCTFDTAKYHTIIPALTANIVCGGGGGTPSTPIPIVGHSEINLDVNGQTFTVQFGQTVYGGVYDKSGRLTITHGYKTYDGSNDEDWGFVDAVNRAYISVSDIDISTPDNDIADVKANIYVSGAYSGNGNRITGRYNIAQINVFDSSVNNISEWRALLSNTPLTIAYELATPIFIDVPSISVFAENGVNNIVSDGGGNVNVSYKDTIQHYIDSRI